MKLIILVSLYICLYSLPVSAKPSLEEITVLTSIYPPYVTNTNNKVGGISVYVANAIFKAAGYKVNYKVLPYQRAVNYLMKDESAIMMGLLAGIADHKKINITGITYTKFQTTYFYNSKLYPGYSKIKSISETSGKRVSSIKGTAHYEQVILKSGGQISHVTSEEQLMKMLIGARVDFAHTGLITGLINIVDNPNFSDIKPLNFNVTSLTSGMLFREKSYHIKDKFLKVAREFFIKKRLHSLYRSSLKPLTKKHAKLMVPSEIGIEENKVPKNK